MMKSKFKLKNYSTSISAEKSIAEIEKILAQFGAQAIIKEFYSDEKVHLLAFRINKISYKLPANIKGTLQALFSGKRNYYGKDSMKAREERAYRVSWRVIKDWLHAQLTLILSGQGEPEQVLFPYAYDGKRTLFQVWKEGKLLTEGKETNDKAQ